MVSLPSRAQNTTSKVLTRVRIEVHLSNGTELGPTTPVDMVPGQVLPVTLPSTQAAFSGWVAPMPRTVEAKEAVSTAMVEGPEANMAPAAGTTTLVVAESMALVVRDREAVRSNQGPLAEMPGFKGDR